LLLEEMQQMEQPAMKAIRLLLTPRGITLPPLIRLRLSLATTPRRRASRMELQAATATAGKALRDACRYLL
jgi:hypothetical protein